MLKQSSCHVTHNSLRAHTRRLPQRVYQNGSSSSRNTGCATQRGEGRPSTTRQGGKANIRSQSKQASNPKKNLGAFNSCPFSFPFYSSPSWLVVFSQNPWPPQFYLLLLLNPYPPPGRPRSCCGIHCLLLSCSAVRQCSREEFKGRGCFLSPEPGHSTPRQKPHLPSGLSPAPVLTRQPGEGWGGGGSSDLALFFQLTAALGAITRPVCSLLWIAALLSISLSLCLQPTSLPIPTPLPLHLCLAQSGAADTVAVAACGVEALQLDWERIAQRRGRAFEEHLLLQRGGEVEVGLTAGQRKSQRNLQEQQAWGARLWPCLWPCWDCAACSSPEEGRALEGSFLFQGIRCKINLRMSLRLRAWNLLWTSQGEALSAGGPQKRP